MSKIFEALQRLERESGKLPPGVLSEAQQVFENGGMTPGSAVSAVASSPDIRVAEPPQELPKAGAVPPHKSFDINQVPVENGKITPASRIVYFSEPESPGADRFRLLRMRLWPIWESGKLKTLLVTSAQAQDGKSTVVLNLATALAEQGQRRVVLVEGDLYHPTLSKRVGLPNLAGLAECLERGEDPLSLLRRIEPVGWYLLSAGELNGNATELLQSPTLAQVFEKLAPHFEWIIIDSPPVIPLTDTLSLKHHADAGLLVVRADRTPRSMVESAVARVGSKHLLGLVFNGSEELERAYSDYGKYYRPLKKRN
jgi:capsular exopolysaccharide synthesis family protein